MSERTLSNMVIDLLAEDSIPLSDAWKYVIFTLVEMEAELKSYRQQQAHVASTQRGQHE
ncbi:hypothetical protein MWH03_00030 [Klebsiella pneumoniae]|nr:hypothetical protein [Klebsiella pneumoniae]